MADGMRKRGARTRTSSLRERAGRRGERRTDRARAARRPRDGREVVRRGRPVRGTRPDRSTPRHHRSDPQEGGGQGARAEREKESRRQARRRRASLRSRSMTGEPGVGARSSSTAGTPARWANSTVRSARLDHGVRSGCRHDGIHQAPRPIAENPADSATAHNSARSPGTAVGGRALRHRVGTTPARTTTRRSPRQDRPFHADRTGRAHRNRIRAPAPSGTPRGKPPSSRAVAIGSASATRISAEISARVAHCSADASQRVGERRPGLDGDGPHRRHIGPRATGGGEDRARCRLPPPRHARRRPRRGHRLPRGRPTR